MKLLIHPLLLKVGHFTMDNASNNDTMMASLQTRLSSRDIAFDAVDRRVMCFAHIIDLCSGRVIRAVSDGAECSDDSSSPENNTAPPNPIAQARATVKAIRGSGSRRDAFTTVITNGNANQWFKDSDTSEIIQLREVQLLWDIPTRWDSVYGMLERLREMRPVCHYTSPHRMRYMLNCQTFRPLITSSLSPNLVMNWPSIRSRLETGLC